MLLKSLIEQISLYPLGTFVQLNAGEIGRVIQINKNLPTRPVVRVIADSSGNAFKKAKDVNLARELPVYIKKSLSSSNSLYNKVRRLN